MTMWQSTILLCIVFTETSNWVNSECIDQDLNNRFLQNAPPSKYLNQILIFKGVYNKKIGELKIYYEKQTLTVKISDSSPHSYFKDQTYVSVEVKDNSGTQKYERIVKGLTAISYDEVPMKEGYLITVFHLEAPARLFSPDGLANTKVNMTTHRFLVTRYGLESLELGNDPLVVFLNKLNLHANDLTRSTSPSIDSDLSHLLVGIRSLPEPYRSQYVMEHNTLMSKCTVNMIVGSTSAQGRVDMALNQGFTNLIGTMVDIKIDDEVVVQDPIKGPTLFRNVYLPYGVYSVEFHGSAAEGYLINPRYIEVRASLNPVQVRFEKINNNLFGNNISLDAQTLLIDKMAREIATDAFRSNISLYLSDEKKLLLSAIRSIPDVRRDVYLDKYSGLFSSNNKEKTHDGSGNDGGNNVDNGIDYGRAKPLRRGGISIIVKSDNSKVLAGRIIRVDGDHATRTQRVTGAGVAFNHLPVGNYRIRIN